MSDYSLSAKIENLYDEACTKVGWNTFYLEDFIEKAVLQGSVIFQAFGYDYGDRIPGYYKLVDTFREIFISIAEQINEGKKDSVGSSTGRFTVRGWYDTDAEQWEFDMYFDLTSFGENRILED